MEVESLGAFWKKKIEKVVVWVLHYTYCLDVHFFSILRGQREISSH